MRENRTEHLRSCSENELVTRMGELTEELFNLRFRNSMRQLEDPVRIREVRRDIARVKTVLVEHRTGVRLLTTKSK